MPSGRWIDGDGKNKPADAEEDFFFLAYPNPQKVGPEQPKKCASAQMEKENVGFLCAVCSVPFTFFPACSHPHPPADSPPSQHTENGRTPTKPSSTNTEAPANTRKVGFSEKVSRAGKGRRGGERKSFSMPRRGVRVCASEGIADRQKRFRW